MSLAGLCLGIGMLVDNSIVVMENVYRFSNEGMSAPKAAVRGTAQVAGPILASTLTTICVFLPMVYTSGMVSQLLIPFAFTISYRCPDNGVGNSSKSKRDKTAMV